MHIQNALHLKAISITTQWHSKRVQWLSPKKTSSALFWYWRKRICINFYLRQCLSRYLCSDNSTKYFGHLLDDKCIGLMTQSNSQKTRLNSLLNLNNGMNNSFRWQDFVTFGCLIRTYQLFRLIMSYLFDPYVKNSLTFYFIFTQDSIQLVHNKNFVRKRCYWLNISQQRQFVIQKSTWIIKWIAHFMVCS